MINREETRDVATEKKWWVILNRRPIWRHRAQGTCRLGQSGNWPIVQKGMKPAETKGSTEEKRSQMFMMSIRTAGTMCFAKQSRFVIEPDVGELVLDSWIRLHGHLFPRRTSCVIAVVIQSLPRGSYHPRKELYKRTSEAHRYRGFKSLASLADEKEPNT